MKKEERKEINIYETEKANKHTHTNDEISVYVLLCKDEEHKLFIPAFTFFDYEEAKQFYEESSDDSKSTCYNKQLIKVQKVFILKNGQIIWANKKAIGTGAAQYITMDFGLHGKPYLYFNTLLSENETDIDAITVARVY